MDPFYTSVRTSAVLSSLIYKNKKHIRLEVLFIL